MAVAACNHLVPGSPALGCQWLLTLLLQECHLAHTGETPAGVQGLVAWTLVLPPRLACLLHVMKMPCCWWLWLVSLY